MTTQTLTASRLRLPAWLLTLSFLPGIAIPITGILTFIVMLPAGMTMSTFDLITPQIMSAIRVGWIAIQIEAFVAAACGTIGIALLANQLKKTTETKVRIFAWVALILALVSLATSAITPLLNISVVGFTEATLGQTWQYQNQFSNFMRYAFLPIGAFSILALSASLASSGWLRRTGWTISVLSALLFLVSLVPSLSAGIPPFVFLLLLMPLGIGLLRRQEA